MISGCIQHANIITLYSLPPKKQMQYGKFEIMLLTIDV